MSRAVNPNKLAVLLKQETDVKRKRQLEKELKLAERERDKRLKDFEKRASAPTVDIAELEKMAAKEPDPITAKKMKRTVQQKKKKQPVKKAATSPATPKAAGMKKSDEKREAKKRLDKFEVMVKKAPDEIKTLTKMMKAETDVPTKKTMMQTIKKLEVDRKKQKAAAASAASSSASSRPTAKSAAEAKGSSPAELKAAQERLKKFETGVMREKRDLKKFEKDVARERDPKLKARMTQILKKAKAKLKR